MLRDMKPQFSEDGTIRGEGGKAKAKAKEQVYYPAATLDFGGGGKRRGEGIGMKRNDVATVDKDTLLDAKTNYVDTFRSRDHVEDIKISVDRAKKAYGADFGKIQRRKDFYKLEMTEEEFAESGGLVGYIERARNLLIRKHYRPAMRYLNFAIGHGVQNLVMSLEPEIILLARRLRARCLLNEHQYFEAQVEAERILQQHNWCPEALLIKGEALYHQCKALMIFHRGSRARLPLYAGDFADGITKATVVIRRALSWLDHEAFRKFFSSISHRKLKNRSEEQIRFETAVQKFFYSNDLTPLDLRSDNPSKFPGPGDPAAPAGAAAAAAGEYFVDVEHTFSVQGSGGLLSIEALSPITTLKAKARRIKDNRKEEDKTYDKAAKRAMAAKKSRMKEMKQLQKSMAGDVNLRRLKHDEVFLSSLRSNLELERSLFVLEEETSKGYGIKRGPMVDRAGRILLEAKKKAGGPARMAVSRNSGLEDIHLRRGSLRKCRSFGPMNRSILRLTRETLMYIDHRKEFWSAQGDASEDKSAEFVSVVLKSTSSRNRGIAVPAVSLTTIED